MLLPQRSDTVLFAERCTADGQVIGVATLNRPRFLHALSLQMVDALQAQLGAWNRDAAVVAVVLNASTPKAFCAGGDVVALVQAIRESRAQGQAGPPPLVKDFFAREYRLDHLVHRFRKPVLAWGEGIVMGGGLGLFVGATHRVVTPTSVVGMPEISIGLFPDVGGSWVLGRLPGRLGVFMALGGAPLSAADALACGLADFHLQPQRLDAVLADMAGSGWTGHQAEDCARLNGLLSGHADKPAQEARVERYRALIDATVGTDGLDGIRQRMAALAAHEDRWLQQCASTFAHGSPTSAALSLHLQAAAKSLGLADVFRMEFNAACHCAVQHDFPEGVRALLIDKDRSPRWSALPAGLRPEQIAQPYVGAPWDAQHPLADLGDAAAGLH
ncbi:MAG TPA: enoyl-CoA hydratase/isomerase family protein [Pseudorhodoferax sp.]|nr:enoyl-CoA hydratase/isomerase family protein [Pseudorhodoferax sp.]